MPVDNGSFRYGYGLFETMLLRNGRIRLAQYHWERLFASMQTLSFEPPPLMTPAKLEGEVLRTASKNGLSSLCRVRLQVFAAGGGMYGLESTAPGYVIECFPLPEEMIALNENGLVAGMAKGLRKSADLLSPLKSANALIYALAARQAKTNKWNDALIYNTEGHIIESTLANIFWEKNGTIYTPPLADGCVAGVMRRHLLAKVPGIQERSLTTEILAEAKAVFLTNAIRTVRWISDIAGNNYQRSLAAQVYNVLSAD